MSPKLLAVKIKSILDKLSTPIIIKSENDISDFLINIYGAKSEAELFNKPQTVKHFNLKYFINYEFNTVHSYSFLNKYDFSSYLKNRNIIIQSPRIISNSVPLLGYSYSEVTKYSEPIILPKGRLCFFSSERDLRESIPNKLILQGSNVINFSLKGEINIKKIDLLNSLLISNSLEEILNLISGANNHFLFVWSLIVKDLIKDDKAFKYDNFLDSFTLDFIIKYYIYTVSNQNYLSKIILSYLKTVPDFNMESPDIKVSNLSHEFHYEQSKSLYTFFYNITLDHQKSNHSCEDLIFEDLSSIFGETVFIGDFSDESYFLLNSILHKINKCDYNFVIFTDSLDIIPINHKNSSFLLFSSYLEKPNSDSFDHFAFGKTEHYIQPDSDIILKIVSLTPELTTNIFDLSGKNISSLVNNEFFFWTPTCKKNHIHSEYSFKKIKLNC